MKCPRCENCIQLHQGEYLGHSNYLPTHGRCSECGLNVRVDQDEEALFFEVIPYIVEDMKGGK